MARPGHPGFRFRGPKADTAGMTIRVVIADDHPLVREGLRRYLDGEADILVVGEASDGRELLEVIDSSDAPPDIVLLDVSMPGMGGVEAARQIRTRHPESDVVMLSAFDERDFVVASVRAGARGYILKTGDTDQVIRATRLVASGTMVIDPSLIPLLVDELLPGERPARAATTSSLTARESEVLQLAAYGKTNREIAQRLSSSPEAVKKHLEHIFQKLHVHDRTEAVAVAIREGLVS